jgi:hypothetical protein
MPPDDDLDEVETRLRRDLENVTCFLMLEAHNPRSEEFQMLEAMKARCRLMLHLVAFKRTMRGLLRVEQGRA